MKRWNAFMKRWNALTRNRLFDIAVGPAPLLIAGRVWVAIGIAVVAVVAIAAWLILRAIRKQKTQGGKGVTASTQNEATITQAGSATSKQSKDGPADGGKA